MVGGGKHRVTIATGLRFAPPSESGCPEHFRRGLGCLGPASDDGITGPQERSGKHMRVFHKWGYPNSWMTY